MSQKQKPKNERILTGLLFGQGVPLTLIVVIGLVVHIATGEITALFDLDDHSMVGMMRGFMVNFVGGVFSLLLAILLLKEKVTATIVLGVFSIVANLALLIWYFFIRTGYDFFSYSPLNYLIGLSCVLLQIIVVIYLLRHRQEA